VKKKGPSEKEKGGKKKRMRLTGERSRASLCKKASSRPKPARVGDLKKRAKEGDNRATGGGKVCPKQEKGEARGLVDNSPSQCPGKVVEGGGGNPQKAATKKSFLKQRAGGKKT